VPQNLTRIILKKAIIYLTDSGIWQFGEFKENRMKRKLLLILSLLACLALLCSCAPGVGGRSAENRAGFFMGIWHGWIAPVSLIWHWFNRDVRLYEVFNTGWAYDFGFYMGVVGGFGSLALSRKRRRDD
jgi:hypothetical protein